VRTFLRRAAAAALSLGLMAGPVALCAEMTPTAEARMACCTDNSCPMHEGGWHGSGPHHQPSQSQADHCCAVSEHHDGPGPSMPMYVGATSNAVLGASVLLPINVPTLVRTDAWRTAAPIPATPVPRHVLLTVFLV
jgi:hypothetical protein